MTLLSIVNDALGEVLGTTISAVAGNADPNAVKCLKMLNRLGYDLQRSRKWPQLKSTFTFNTVAGTATYALPTGFQRFSNSSQWDRTAHWPMNGPATDAFWQVLQSGLVIAGMRFWFRMDSGGFDIAPTPTGVRTIAYDFYTTAWAASASGTPQKAFLADTDVPVFLINDNAEDLLTLGLLYKIKESIGLPYGEAKQNYIDAIDSEAFDSRGQPLIDTTGNPRYVLGRGNLPEIGYGL